MTQSWNLDSNSTNDKKTDFTKFPVGVTRIRIIDDAPHQRWTHWMPQYRRSVNCPGKGCPIDEIRRQQKANGEQYTYNMTKRFAINIINRETGLQEVMEQGKTFFEDVRILMEELREEGKTLKDVDLKIRRTGTGKDDTRYRIDIDEEYELTKEDESLKSKKIELSDYFKSHTPEQILQLLDFQGGTPTEYLDKWVEVNTNDESGKETEVGEEIELR